MQNPKKSTAKAIEVITCHAGTPAGRRVIIVMGDVSGIIENHTARLPFGLVDMEGINMIDNSSGIVTGSVYCCESLSLSTTEPVAA